MEETLRAILRTSAGVSAITTTIEWDAAPQGAPLPFVVLNTISGAEGMTLDGSDELFDGRVQVDCYGATKGVAVALGRAVNATLHGFAGQGFQGVFHVNTRATREGGTDEASRPFRVGLDYTVVFSA